MISRKEALTELAGRMAAEFAGQVEVYFFENQYSPGWHWLTIHDRKATKAQAVRTLMDSLGLGSSELTVFGDDVNDLHMFAIADAGVAVANAKDELKRHASAVIGSNEEDSVVRYLLTDYTSNRRSTKCR